MFDRSILVLISSSPRQWARGLRLDDACASPSRGNGPAPFLLHGLPENWSGSSSRSPRRAVSTSRMALLLTSSSLARSLIRTLLIRPFLSSAVALGLHCTLTESSSLHAARPANCFARAITILLFHERSRALPSCSGFFVRCQLRLLHATASAGFAGSASRGRFRLRFGCFRLRLLPAAALLPPQLHLPPPSAATRLRPTFQAGEVIIHRQADFFHRLRPDALDSFQLLRRHVGQGFDRSHAGRASFSTRPSPSPGHILERRGRLRRQRRHLQLHFLALLFFALDVDLPAQQLRREADVLPLLADRKRKLAVVDHDFKMLVRAVDHGDAADLRGLQRLLGERDRRLRDTR